MAKYKKSRIQDVDYSKLSLTGLFSFDREVIESPTSPILHQAARFLFFLDGEGAINLNGEPFKIKKGTLISVMPWDFSEVTKVIRPMQYFIFKYNVDLVNSFVKYFQDSKNGFLKLMQEKHVLYCNDEEMDIILGIFLTAMEELGEESMFEKVEKEPLCDVLIVAKIVELITFFVRHQIEGDKAKDKDIKKDLGKNFINVFKYMYSHLSENLTVSSVARVFFTNKTTLSKYIKSTTGYSFEELLGEMKINKTMEMLLYTQLSIGEIADILGFVDQAHLTNFFRKNMGRTPGKFRQSFKPETVLYNNSEVREFYRILDYVCINYAQDISIETVAEAFELSTVKINEMFLYHIERTFSNFLNFIRINRASVLLMKTDRSATDIAFDVGYNNTKTFFRNFYKFRAMTPTEFKNKSKLQDFDL